MEAAIDSEIPPELYSSLRLRPEAVRRRQQPDD